MSDIGIFPSSSPSPSPFPQCDYSEWAPTFAIIPTVYVLAFVLGSLGNSLVLWVYLDRAEGKRTVPTCTKNLRRSRSPAQLTCYRETKSGEQREWGSDETSSSHNMTASPDRLKPQPLHQLRPQPKLQSQVQSQPQLQLLSQPQPQPQLQSQPQPQLQLQAQSQSQPQPQPQPLLQSPRQPRLLSAAYPSRPPRTSRSLTDSLIASLALADLAFVVTLPLWASYTALDYHWLFGGPLCQVSSFLVALNMYASVFSLSALSVERYWVLAGRRQSSTNQRPSRVFWVVGGVWALAGVLALPALVLRTVKEVELGVESEDEQISGLDQKELTKQSAIIICSCQMDYSSLIGAELEEDRERGEMMWTAALGLKSTVIGFLLPLAILLICYCSLARILSRHFGHGPRPDRKRQHRLLRVIVTLVMAFFLCWLPLHVNKTLSMMLELELLPYSCALDQVLLTAHPYVTCLAYLNSCLNPLLYACCDSAFRKRCSTLLQWRRWRKACRKERLGLQGDRVEEKEGEEDEDREQASRSSTFPTRTQGDTGFGVEEREDAEKTGREVGEGEDKSIPVNTLTPPWEMSNLH